ncbi:MAG: hypothetical protein M4579_002892 [Chaenotheca gracillima]|nr:MAG: hypothetical protein M4579_002892 [Chaenotheca gracillima]
MVATFTDIFLYAVIVPVIPFALTDRIGVPQDEAQHWVSILLAVYGAALLAGSPVCGWFADRSKSRRLPLLVGLVALAGATVMLCVGNTIGLLIAGRVLQGLSAAVVWTVGLALLVDTVGKDAVGQSMGYVSLAMTLGTLVAPTLGGVVYAKGGYYSVFAMAFGIIALDIFLRLVLIEKKAAAKWSMPNQGASYGTCPASQPGSPVDTRNEEKAASLDEDSREEAEPGPSQAGEQHESPRVPGPSSPKHKSRLPPVLTLLKSRRLLSALWGCLIQASLMTSFDSVLPLYCQATFGWSSTGAGIIFLALFIPCFSAPGIGYLVDKYGPRYLATGGFILGVPFYVLLRLVDHNSLKQKVLLCALLAIIGFSLTLVMAPLMTEITYVVEAKEKSERESGNGETRFKQGAYAQAYGLFNCAFAGGTLLGPLLAGFVSAQAGWGTMAWALALLSGVSAVPAVIFTGGLISRHKRNKADSPRQQDSPVDEESQT